MSEQEIKDTVPAMPPQSVPALRTLAMPADVNPNGDIFGGWLMSQMDVAGGIHAYALSSGRIATVAVDGMSFHLPVQIGDLISCHCVTQRTGTTSIAVKGQPRPLSVGES